MSKKIVAAAQLGGVSPAHTETVDRVVSLITQAGAAGAELVVLPELSLSSYFAAAIHEDVREFFEPTMPSDDTIGIFAAAAARHTAVVLPFAELDGTAHFNSAVLIDAAGEETGRFRKVHIPGFTEPAPDGSFRLYEKRYFTSGDLGFPVYPSPVGPLSMLICADRRYPESYRCCALAGAEVIAIGYNTPWGTGPTSSPSAEAGQALSELAMRGGAYANGVHIIASGKAGVENGCSYIGGSIIIGPQGEVLAKAMTDGDELVLAEIDLDAAAKIRERLNLELNRHPEHYSILTRTPVVA